MSTQESLLPRAPDLPEPVRRRELHVARTRRAGHYDVRVIAGDYTFMVEAKGVNVDIAAKNAATELRKFIASRECGPVRIQVLGDGGACLYEVPDARVLLR